MDDVWLIHCRCAHVFCELECTRVEHDIHLAVWDDTGRRMKACLDNRHINVNHLGRGGYTPLYISAVNNRTAVLRLLLARADVNVGAPLPRNLDLAACLIIFNCPESFKLLLAHRGKDLDPQKSLDYLQRHINALRFSEKGDFYEEGERLLRELQADPAGTMRKLLEELYPTLPEPPEATGPLVSGAMDEID
jgi:hypothetical protein